MTTVAFQEPDQEVVEEPTLPIPGLDPVRDGDAPWGRRADGTPKAKPGAKPGARASGGPRKAASPGPRKATGATAKKVEEGPDYRPALIGLGMLPVALGNMAVKFIKNEEKKKAVGLDVLTWRLHMPGIAVAVNDLAQTNAKIASLLDRIVAVGPYSQIFAAVTPMLLQVLVNHGVADPRPEMGTLPPELLIETAAGL